MEETTATGTVARAACIGIAEGGQGGWAANPDWKLSQECDNTASDEAQSWPQLASDSLRLAVSVMVCAQTADLATWEAAAQVRRWCDPPPCSSSLPLHKVAGT